MLPSANGRPADSQSVNRSSTLLGSAMQYPSDEAHKQWGFESLFPRKVFGPFSLGESPNGRATTIQVVNNPASLLGYCITWTPSKSGDCTRLKPATARIETGGVHCSIHSVNLTSKIVGSTPTPCTRDF